MPSPLYSGAAAYLLSGFALDKDLGWDYFKNLKTNELASVKGNGAVLKSVASGEKPYGILVDFMALNAKAKGSPIEFVFPSEGVPAVTEPVAIMATAKTSMVPRSSLISSCRMMARSWHLSRAICLPRKALVARHGCRKAPRLTSCRLILRRFWVRRMPTRSSSPSCSADKAF